MFRMLGDKVELIRYTVAYTEDEREIVESCISEEHKQEIENLLTDKGIEFTTSQKNQVLNEWLNGLEFNSFDEAFEVFNGGEALYRQNIEKPLSVQISELKTKQIETNQLVADSSTAQQELLELLIDMGVI